MVIFVERIGQGTDSEPFSADIPSDKAWRIINELEDGFEIEIFGGHVESE